MNVTRSAVITGGGTGLGRASAVELNRRGYDITIVGRRADVLYRAASEIAAAGNGPLVATEVADVGEPDGGAAAVNAHVDRVGGIDALVACAGSYEPTRLTALTARSWDATMNAQLRGAVLSAAAAARHMTAAGSGRIVLISSVNGVHNEPDTAAYSAAKAAIISVTRSFAVDLAGTGITTNAIAPGWVDTAMTADYLATTTPEQMRRVNTLGRAGRPEEIAAVVGFLVAEAPDFLTGTTIMVDGGQTALAPMP